MTLANPARATLAATAALLVSGGDERIALDPASGRSPYGCAARPDPDLVALGSSTASVISEAGYAVADALRLACLDQLGRHPAAAVYAMQIERLRGELLQLCGLHPSDGVGAVLCASGTDAHLLAAQWLRARRVVTVAACETGSGVPAALQGRHFNRRSAYGGAVAPDSRLDDWQGELTTLAPRHPDGRLRDPAALDAECAAAVGAAAAAGDSVLLVLTDVSKTGLIVPSVDTALALKQRWPQQVEVLVDACQFRLAPATLRAYLAHGMLLVLTGSKFVSGPTFCGALLIPRPVAARHQRQALPPALGDYSCVADWPAGWPQAGALPVAANFGLLLRWAAALAELRRFHALPEDAVGAFLGAYGAAMHVSLASDACFEELPVAPLWRHALGAPHSWDAQQTIFPFLLFRPDGAGGRRPLSREATLKIYRDLLQPADGGQRFQLGQPVACGQRGAVPVSALRLCVSARMIATAGGSAHAIAEARAALGAIRRLILAN